ncbi:MULTISPECIES: TOBE domain-containing protein [Flavobacterium]|uniref:Tobe domain protein n=1 Tax=Flavobacterium gawalongense TaxID=2594432 RepID=A0ABY3CJE6_9FLAO|nr:TOBE domain-containing protein [Flavobacterium gawalongense]TRX01239.1 tobe domain protein [Flavobacterium gawalongense]TRX05236.1 tobe domain protein [Flavobacterium gawalongense]
MNTLNGTITTIQSHEGISLVKVKSGNTIFTSIVLDSPETVSYLKTDYPVKILFKETEVIVAKDLNPNISIQNRVLCSIQSIKKGAILSQIDLLFGELIIKSIITTNACDQLELKEKDTVLALIKTNEVSLSPND